MSNHCYIWVSMCLVVSNQCPKMSSGFLQSYNFDLHCYCCALLSHHMSLHCPIMISKWLTMQSLCLITSNGPLLRNNFAIVWYFVPYESSLCLKNSWVLWCPTKSTFWHIMLLKCLLVPLLCLNIPSVRDIMLLRNYAIMPNCNIYISNNDIKVSFCVITLANSKYLIQQTIELLLCLLVKSLGPIEPFFLYYNCSILLYHYFSLVCHHYALLSHHNVMPCHLNVLMSILWWHDKLLCQYCDCSLLSHYIASYPISMS